MTSRFNLLPDGVTQDAFNQAFGGPDEIHDESEYWVHECHYHPELADDNRE